MKTSKQLKYGFFLFGFTLLSASIQILTSPFPLVKAASLFVIILSSLALGAFAREYFVQKQQPSAGENQKT